MTKPVHMLTSKREAKLSRPKRPLSAFNLFYRFKRQKVLTALAADASLDKETLCALVAAAPGMESYTANTPRIVNSPTLNAIRRESIRRDLEQNLEPRDAKARVHRKSQTLNGVMNFVELGQAMNSSWMNCDEYARSVFKELADEGRERYLERVEAYKAEHGKKMRRRAKKKKVQGNNVMVASKRNSVDDGTVNEAAEIMVQLHNKGLQGREVSPGLLDLLSEKVAPKEQIANDEAARVSPHAPPNAFSTQQAAIPLRLAEESLLSRIHELEAEMLRHKTRQGLLRSALLNKAVSSRTMASAVAPAPAPSRPAMQDGLWSLMSARSMIAPDVQPSGQAAMLSRIVESSHIASSEAPNKKLRHA